MNNPNSIESVYFRKALLKDFSQIRTLIHKVKINPFGLDWRHFWVAVDGKDQIIGCGQVKLHADGSQELASIAVEQSWRSKGIARILINHLMNQPRGTLYLTCRSRLGDFYKQFGFMVADEKDMTPYFKRLHRLSRFLYRLRRMDDQLLIMVYKGS